MLKARLLPLLVAYLLLCGCSDDHRWPTQRFDATKWKAAKESEPYIYVKDLLGRKLLIGKNSNEVEALLGNPEKSYLALHLETRIEGIGSKDPRQFYREDFHIKGTGTDPREGIYYLVLKFTKDKRAYSAFVRRETY